MCGKIGSVLLNLNELGCLMTLRLLKLWCTEW